MRKAVLFIISVFVFAGCVSTKAFRALELKVNGMEHIQKLKTIKLAQTVIAVDAHDNNILQLAKAANFLFKQFDQAHNQLMVVEAGVMQNDRDLESLDGKVDKLGAKLARLKRELAEQRKNAKANADDVAKMEQEFARMELNLDIIKNFLLNHLRMKK